MRTGRGFLFGRMPAGVVFAWLCLGHAAFAPVMLASAAEPGRAQAVASESESLAKIRPIHADLMGDLDRLAKPKRGGEVYDLFSRPGTPAPTQPRHTARPKSGVTAPRIFGTPAKTEIVVSSPIVMAPSGASSAAGAVPGAMPPLASQLPVVAASPLPPPPPPPPPKPPAVPFTYMGRLDQGDRVKYFLLKADRLYVVTPGDEIDDAYVFDGEVGNQLQLTYKPLRIAQTLVVGP